jgi:hypothetical protein
MRSATNRLTYEGEVYVRPVGRGVVLEEHPDRAYLDDWLETGSSSGTPASSEEAAPSASAS